MVPRVPFIELEYADVELDVAEYESVADPLALVPRLSLTML